MTDPADPSASSVGPMPSPSPEEGPALPAAPRPSIAHRLSGHRRARYLYKVANRLERKRFLDSLPGSALAPGTFVSRRDGRLVLYRTRPGMTADVARSENLRLVAELLDRHDVDYFAAPESGSGSVNIGMAPQEWTRFLEVLGAAPEGTEQLYVALLTRDRRGDVRWWSAPLQDPRVRPALATQTHIILFEVRAAHEHGEIYGRGQGIHLQRWERDEDGALESPTRNTRTRHISATLQQSTQLTVAGTSLRTFAPLATRHVFDFDLDVDLVYLWVDDSDPQWRSRRAEALRRAGRPVDEAPVESGVSAERFRDYGELRYALRSAHRYAPWARNIFLVTDRQVPGWLDTDHPGVTVVDHREIFEHPDQLPTFNSHSIGSRLHHIEGLSEHYLYINDDVFFGRPVSPQQFFHPNGVAKFFMSRSTLPLAPPGEGPPHENARRNVARLLEEHFGRTATRNFFHTPVPQRREIFADLEATFPEVFEQNVTSRFRSRQDYEPNQWLHHYYGYLKGMAAPGSIRYDYFDLSDPSIPERMSRLMDRRNRDCFCINDNAEALPENQDFIVDWMAEYFPEPAPFENGP